MDEIGFVDLMPGSGHGQGGWVDVAQVEVYGGSVPGRRVGVSVDCGSFQELERLTRELENFEDIARYLLPQPGEVPRLRGIDVYGGTLPLNGAVGGDHIIYVDFKQRFDLEARIAARASRQGRLDVVENLQRCQTTAGIALIDVSGHRMTDALLAAMLHQAFLLGAIYELDMFGQITRRLFENLNTRFYQSSGAHKFISLIYGEISEDAMFRFLSAGAAVSAGLLAASTIASWT